MFMQLITLTLKDLNKNSQMINNNLLRNIRVLAQEPMNEDDQTIVILFVIVICIILISLAYLLVKMFNRQNPLQQLHIHNLLQDGERKGDNNQLKFKQQLKQSGINNQEILNSEVGKTLKLEHIEKKSKNNQSLNYVTKQVNISIQEEIDDQKTYKKNSQEDAEIELQHVEMEINGPSIRDFSHRSSDHNLSNVFNLENEESQYQKPKAIANGNLYKKV